MDGDEARLALLRMRSRWSMAFAEMTSGVRLSAPIIWESSVASLSRPTATICHRVSIVSDRLDTITYLLRSHGLDSSECLAEQVRVIGIRLSVQGCVDELIQRVSGFRRIVAVLNAECQSLELDPHGEDDRRPVPITHTGTGIERRDVMEITAGA